MDPISPQAATLVSNLQALQVRQGTPLESSALLALLGQDVEALLQSLTSGSVKLQLPSGQTVTAQGELPYPEGTQLRLRILPAASGETGLRLLLQEARPPAPPALLSPLMQGEAWTLANRLNQDSLSLELAPLLKLLSVLADAPFGGQPAALPSTAALQAALGQLPEALSTSLGRALGAGGLASTQELTASLQALFQEVQKRIPDSRAALLNTLASATPLASDPAQGLQTLIQQVLSRFQTLVSQHPEIPANHKDFLGTWIRTQLQKTAPSESGPQASAKPGQLSPPLRVGTTASPDAADALIPPKLMAALEAHSGPKAAIPESWESWIRGTITTLTSPEVSPREATFHALQAKEGTAFFDLPLPWAQASPLQIWVEGDASEERERRPDGTKRVLLGLKFSNLGETRLGMAQGSFGLQIRVWTEHPEALEAGQERMEAELKDLGKAVDLRIYTLTAGAAGTIPSLRSVVVGSSLSALG